MSRITVRELIVNACDEARLVNRSQPIPGSIFLSAYTLLQKRLSQYSNTNLLSFTRKEINFNPEGTEVIIGNDEEESEYTSDIEVNKLQEVVRVYFRPLNSTENQWKELDFVSYEDFYSWTNNSYVYSVLPLDDNHIKLLTKNNIANGPYELKMIYNEPFEFDQDSELNIPRQFVALFTAGLVYDLALQYPRLSDNTVAMLKSRLDELEENVRRSSAVNKIITRDTVRVGLSYSDFITGKFLGL